MIQIERFNGIIAQTLSMYVSCDQKDWDQHIPSVLFAYRVTPSESTGDSPFYLLYGRECVTPPDVALFPPVELSSSIDEHRRRIVSQIEEAQQIARDNIQKTQQKMKYLYDRNAENPDFQVGQRVWVFTPLRRKGLPPKLMHRWHGPFRIGKKLSEVHFLLRTLDNNLVTTTFHANRMKAYHEPDDRPILPPDIDNSEPYLRDEDLPPDSFDTGPYSTTTEETAQIEPSTQISDDASPNDQSDIYQVEKVLRKRKRRGKTEYLVKWAGYSNRYNSWEPEGNFVDSNAINFDR